VHTFSGGKLVATFLRAPTYPAVNFSGRAHLAGTNLPGGMMFLCANRPREFFAGISLPGGETFSRATLPGDSSRAPAYPAVSLSRAPADRKVSCGRKLTLR